ncbi:energy transducer TonB [Pseudoprevotella muciniphila]|uniref:Energy transducer TonB n=1 Tax=Pseudoprevotella muciniphila TaxID=2133944 RepID=A0A5P8E8U1_9BACT|nr:energy transducer TonB [Pseudoprevotella muciniphila]QFQ13383.1 energy transducer TonB [Pseudoprevotella muciniphila]
MAKIDLKSKEWVDLIFEGRNKEYGAYRLRKNAGKRTLYAVIWVAVGIVAILMAVGLYMGVSAAIASISDDSATELSNLEYEDKKQDEKKEEEKKDEPKQIEKPKQEEQVQQTEVQQDQPKQAEVAPPKLAQDLQQLTNVVVKKDNEVNKESVMKAQDDVMKNTAAISDRAFKGVKGGDFATSKDYITNDRNAGVTGNKFSGPGKKESTGTAPKLDVKNVAKNAAKDDSHIERHPAVEAKYPGNWIQYLQSHLKYPAIAIEQEVQGIVRIEFVVGKDGSISQMKVLKSLSKECDAEAMRVIRSAKWTPGKDEQGNAITSIKVQEVQYVLQ